MLDREIFTDGDKHWIQYGDNPRRVFIETRNCAGCKKDFWARKNARPSPFCSSACANGFTEELFITRKDGGRLRAKMVSCVVCGNSWAVRLGRNPKFCSVGCRNRDGAEAKVDVPCAVCAKPCSRRESAKKRFAFCSMECSQTGRQRTSGLYSTAISSDLAKRIWQRQEFPFVCCDCGEKRRFVLELHHIDGNRENNPLDGSNWETCCSTCHTIRHLKQNEDGKWVYYSRALTPRELIPMFSDPNFGNDTAPIQTDPLEELVKVA